MCKESFPNRRNDEKIFAGKADGRLIDDSLFSVQGKVVIVAGAGGGLGSEISRALQARQARLVLFDIDDARLRTVADDCPGAEILNADIRDEVALRTVIERAQKKFERIDGVINAAGLLPIATAVSFDESIFRECMEVNVTGAFLLSRVAAEAMAETGGRIIHLASVSSQVANAQYAAYASSKAALSQLVRVLAREWAALNITVNAIGPALTATPLTDDYLADPEFRANAVAAIPMGRLGEPEDLLGTVVLLLAAGGSFITGQTIYVDGGRTLV